MSRPLSFPHPVTADEVRAAAEEFASTVPGAYLRRNEEVLTLFLPTHSRFYEGEASLTIRPSQPGPSHDLEISISLDRVILTGGGRTLLALGAAGTLPWILWPFFPGLLPLLPMGVLFLFLAWLAVGRRPHSMTEEMVTLEMEKRLLRTEKT